MTSANALYVLRLVWGGNPNLGVRTSRRFSSAVLRAADSGAAATAPLSTATETCAPAGDSTPTTEATVSTSTSTSTSTSEMPFSEFLETDENEYASAATFLPSRTHTGAPIPWPTLFSPAAQAAVHKPRPCDLVARLVAENRLEPARKVCAELSALHTPIVPRKLYLAAAAASLATSKADFLFWLALYPNRPATRNTPGLKNEWAPVVDALLADHLGDTDFIAQFLRVAGTKGMLPRVLPPLLAPLATTAPPNVSEAIVEGAIAAYRAATTSATSTSARATSFKQLVDQQVADWWNMYLRALAIAGWTESARALLFSPPRGVRWTLMTRTVALEQGLTRRAEAVAAAQAREAAERDDPLLAVRRPRSDPLPQRIRAALSNRRLPHVGDLARIQAELLALGRTSLLARFKRRFLSSGSGAGAEAGTAPRKGTRRSKVVPSVKAAWWAHAEIMRLVTAEQHAEAVAHFDRHFLWIGLPRPSSVPSSTSSSTSASTSAPPSATDSVTSTTGIRVLSTRRIPNIQVITTLVPSILALENNPTEYHAKYLACARDAAPVLRPTAYTHLAFVRALGNSTRGRDERASAAVETIVAAGYDPGLPAWNAVLLALQVRGQVEAAMRLLASMQRRLEAPGSAAAAGSISGASTASGSIALPAPNVRTYAGLIQTAARSGHPEQARMYLSHFRSYLAARATRGGDVRADERAMSRITKGVVRPEAAGAGGGGEETVGRGVQVDEVVEERRAAAGSS